MIFVCRESQCQRALRKQMIAFGWKKLWNSDSNKSYKAITDRTDKPTLIWNIVHVATLLQLPLCWKVVFFFVRLNDYNQSIAVWWIIVGTHRTRESDRCPFAIEWDVTEIRLLCAGCYLLHVELSSMRIPSNRNGRKILNSPFSVSACGRVQYLMLIRIVSSSLSAIQFNPSCLHSRLTLPRACIDYILIWKMRTIIVLVGCF